MKNIEEKYKAARKRLKEGLSIDQTMIDFIDESYNHILRTFDFGGKIIWCGNGGSASMASHLSAEFVGTFKIHNRKALNSISLSAESSLITAIANDFDFADIFSRQIEGLANKNDLLFVLSTSGESKNIINAIKISKKIGIKTIAFLGNGGGLCKDIADINIIINSSNTATIQEAHLFLGHLMCDLIDENFSN